MSDRTEKNSQIANAPIAGPSAAELHQQFRPRSLDEIAREHRQQIEESVRTFNGGK
jgi:hypothetical protein